MRDGARMLLIVWMKKAETQGKRDDAFRENVRVQDQGDIEIERVMVTP